MVIKLKLSKEQRAAAKSLTGSHLLIACPGAGKTSVLLERVENLINSGVNPEKILTITFSKTAATELENRFSNKMENLKSAPHFQTIHAFSYRVIRDYSKNKGLNLKLLEGSKEVNKYKLLSNFYKEVHNEYISEEKLDALVNRIGYIKNMMLDQEEDLLEEIDRFSELFSMYENFKKKYKYIDFDDMLAMGLNILKKDSTLRRKYVNMYDFIQVDEGQDTSKLQMEIIKLLTKDRNNLFIVADDDQSIYSFRGADPQGLFDLQKFFPDLKVHYMETNYRCSKNIVTAANNFINQNKVRYDKNLKSDRDYTSPVEVVKVKDLKAQYEYILNDIQENKLKNCAILYRNNVSAMGIVEYFESENVKFQVKDNLKIRFHTHRISVDLLDILKFSENPEKLEYFENIYYKVHGYISRLMIEQLKILGKSGNVLDNLMDTEGLKSYSKREISKLKDNFKRLKNLPMGGKIDFIMDHLGYKKYMEYSSKKESLGLQGELIVLETLKRISKTSTSLKTFQGRLKYLDNLMDNSTKEKKDIFLSTIHSAKGKEYKHVYLIDLFEGMFPSKESKKSDPIIAEEERRLFYVGMTRAKDTLTILFPGIVGENKTEVSTFLKELSQVT
jgi:DNA helicase-2/ATP-dependent DNA helicase PcrA